MNTKKTKILRIATVAMSLDILLKGQLAFMHRHFDIKAISGLDQHLVNVHEREGVPTIAVTISRSINLFQDIKSLIKLYKIFKKERPAIVHSITPKAGLLSMVAGKLAGVPIRVHTFTGLIFPYKTGVFQKVLIFMDKILCKCATHIFPEGQGVKNDLIKYNITRKPLEIIANGNVNGVDMDYFNPNALHQEALMQLKKELNISENDFVFIFVGRLVRDKGINELIDAFSSLTQKHTGIKLLLLGSFEEELDPLLPETISEINNHQSITAVGFQNDIRPYLSLSNVLVFPSYREGFPNVVLQAGAMGLPAIVTNISGSNEIITSDVNGTIIPVKDTLALENAMLKFITDSNYYQKLKPNTRSIIAEKYEQQIVWNALLDEYKKMLRNL